MKIKTFIVAALAVLSMNATAQEKIKVVDKVTPRTVQEFDHQEVNHYFKSHFFLNAQGGAQYNLGEADFTDLLTPNVQLGIGYQFNPWFAARLAANAWQGKGGWGADRLGNRTNNEVLYKWTYVAPGIDFMFNLSNAFCGWNPKRVFSVTAFVGGGANVAWGNDEAADAAAKGYDLKYLWDGTKVKPVGRGGLQFGFRLSDAVSLILEGNANVTNDKYNSKKAGNPDWYFNALAGLRVNLGKSVRTETKEFYRDVVVYDTVYKFIEPEPAPVVVKKEPLRRDIFFTINSTKIDEAEAQKVVDVVNFLNENPEAKVIVSGYADAGTGNDRINDRLAAGRAEIVVKALVEKYNIAAERVASESWGSRVQPFANNDLNRVTVCIAE